MTRASCPLDKLVPFHLELDSELRVRSAGVGLRAITTGDLTGKSLFEVVSIVRPVLHAPGDLRKMTGAMLHCRLLQKPLTLRAQVIDLGEDGFLFASTPWVTCEEDFERAGLSPRLAGPHEGWADFFLQTRLLEQQRLDLGKLVNELEDREARLRAIIDTAIDAILTIDEGCRIERVNPAVERLFGHLPVDIVGRDVATLIPFVDTWGHGAAARSCTPNPFPLREHGLRFLESCAASGARAEVTAVRKDGTAFAAELGVSKLLVRGQRRYTAILRDISERKKLEKLQSEFVSTVSHELRTPLTAIRGALGLIAGGVTGELPAEAGECVNIALSNSERLIHLINDILDMEKIQSGQMDFRMKAVELRAVIRAGVAANEAFAAAHGIAVRFAEDAPEGEVIADELRLHQVLANLISNAAKFSPPGELVEVTVSQVGEWMRVSVRDRGAGIPEEFRARIFQRFAQADMSTTRPRGGTGLGLSISKTIVENMRGRIGFEPARDCGTVFFFDLPRV